MTTIRNSSRAFLLIALCALTTPARAADDLRSAEEEDRIIARLASDPATVVKDAGAGGGVTGARRLSLRFEDGEELEVKWKPVPDGMDGWNNSPRKELAAYEVQRVFLDPVDHVVPTTVLRCLPPEAFQPVGGNPKPNVAGSRCVLGEVEVWLHAVHIPDHIYDAELFAQDRVYAAHMADMNLFTYLIKHQDGRASNFLLGDDPANRRVFSIDNGIAFGAPIHNFFVKNWHEIRVPALRKEAVERLRAAPPDVFDRLAVVVEMKRGEDGVLRAVPETAAHHPEEGIYLGPGELQLGLSRDEIAELSARRKLLLEAVDASRIKTF
jgi:hypothetical protein